MAVHPSSSVQAVRQALAERLRELRLDVSPRLTARALAAACGWHESKVSRIESAKQAASDEDIRVWCLACGADEEIDSLISLNRRADKSYVEWRRAMRRGLTQFQNSFLPRWARTRHFKVYEPGVIPGLCQSPGYAEAVLGAVSRFYGMPADLGEAAAARTARARLLHEPGHCFAFLVEESALRHRIGGTATMADQLRHLLDIAVLPNVSFSVIPHVADRWLFPVEGFWVYDDEEILVETVSAQLTITDPREVQLYVRTFQELTASAVYGADARSLIRSALADLE